MKKGYVKRVVKSPKGVWQTGKNGSAQCIPHGETIELSAVSAASHIKRGTLYPVGKYEGEVKAAEVALQVSQDEKDARNAPDDDVNDDTEGTEGNDDTEDDSKES